MLVDGDAGDGRSSRSGRVVVSVSGNPVVLQGGNLNLRFRRTTNSSDSLVQHVVQATMIGAGCGTPF